MTANASRTVCVVGTDEAGYGPNLGPLLVGASCWRVVVPDSPDAPKAPATLFDALPNFQTPPPNDRAVARLNEALADVAARNGVFPLVDSKKLYAAKSLAALERSFWIAAFLVAENSSRAPERERPRARESFAAVLRDVAREDGAKTPPWERGVDFSLPSDPKTGDLAALAPALERVRETFAAEKIALLDVAAKRVQPREFNAALDALGLKSSLVAETTLSLAVETIDRAARRDLPAEARFVVLCDKLGGRDAYAPILAARFPGVEIQTLAETRARGVYRLAARRALAGGVPLDFPGELDLEFHFTAKGEANAPTALASIVAKYLRELSMKPFNDYWRAQVGPDLRPTAGYPVDAKRFFAETADARARLGTPDEVFWRKK
ncbi:MAG: hypothetical protein HUK22_08075 [Thermoguttaceae bacterium]|nr:hypothetical protein [Thermoguttaceae bacterium]